LDLTTVSEGEKYAGRKMHAFMGDGGCNVWFYYNAKMFSLQENIQLFY
jgi:hypothetical protein